MSWPTTALGRAEVMGLVVGSAPFVAGRAEFRKRRIVGLELVFDWLGAMPGGTWQQRWLSVEADVVGTAWRRVRMAFLAERAQPVGWHGDFMGIGLRVAVSADVVRPSFAWLLSGGMGNGALVRALAASRDCAGFARLRGHCTADPEISMKATTHTAYRAGLIMAAKGGTLDDIIPGDVLELFEAEADTQGEISGGAPLFYRVLHEMACSARGLHQSCERCAPPASSVPSS